MKKIIEKMKKVKHIEIYLAVIAVVIIIMIYFSSLPTTENNSETESSVQNTSTDTYADIMEGKLRNLIGSISGAGNVAVMVMTNGEGTAELAYNKEEETVSQTGSNGQIITTTTKNEELILNSGKPIILWTNPPEIIGIVIVATGAYDVSVKLNILRAVQTIIGDNVVDIEILPGR